MDASRIGLYAALFAITAVLLFPFYWVLSSSVKSREGMAMSPPAFYPSEVRKESIEIAADGRVFSHAGNDWLLLARSEDKLNGGEEMGDYYVRLNADGPSQLVAWLPNAAVQPQPTDQRIYRFPRAQVHILENESRIAILAKMVRQNEEQNRVDELLFAVPAGSDTVADILTFHNVPHTEIRQWHFRWANYPETLAGPEAAIGEESTGFFTYMRNSFFISFLAVLGQVLSSSLVAYGFARLQFKGRELLFIFLLATMMIPGQVTLIPLFSIYKYLGWIDTFFPLIILHFTAGAFNVFLMRQYMLTLPKELDESAAMDGCGTFRTYFYIILPNCVPVLIVVGLFTFVYTWQDVMGPLIYLDNPEYRTVTLGLEYFRSPYVDNRHLLMTGAVLAMLPVAALFAFFQRYIMSGIATTGLKG
ncbi:MAG: carbohydrate ABC transporter permease [Candidatus Latescibacterota bacterium]|nr:carbohydrate ABC transporter permease [Candidatus Latescibacterota bacterium]